MKKTAAFIISFLIIAAPTVGLLHLNFAEAQSSPVVVPPANPVVVPPANPVAVPPASTNCANGGTNCIPNPLGSQTTSLCALIKAIINIVAELGSIVAVLFILLSGFQFIRAQGNPKGIEDAKRTFYYTLIGLAILLGAYVITQIIWGTINSIITLPGGTCT